MDTKGFFESPTRKGFVRMEISFFFEVGPAALLCHVARPVFHGVVERMARIIEQPSSFHLETSSPSAPHGYSVNQVIANENGGIFDIPFVTLGLQSASFERQRRFFGGATMSQSERDRHIQSEAHVAGKLAMLVRTRFQFRAVVENTY